MCSVSKFGKLLQFHALYSPKNYLYQLDEVTSDLSDYLVN
jgi:hypothetical protein